MLTKHILLFAFYFTLIPSETWAVKLYPDNEILSEGSSNHKAQSRTQAREKYPTVVRLEKKGFFGHVGSGVICSLGDEAVPFLLTNYHVVEDAKKMRVISPLFLKNKATKAIFQFLKFEHPEGAEDPTTEVNDLAIGIFKYPDLVRTFLNERSISPASLTHLETMPPPHVAFQEPTPAEIIGCGGENKPDLALITTHISNFKGTTSENLARLNEHLAAQNEYLRRCTENLNQIKKSRELIESLRYRKKGKTSSDEERNLLEAEGENNDIQDNDIARHKFEEILEAPDLEDPSSQEESLELREAALPSGPLWGHTEPGDSGGGVFVNNGELAALTCKSHDGDYTTINGHAICDDSYVPLQKHVFWIKAQVAALRVGIVRQTPDEVQVILRSYDAAGAGCSCTLL